MATVQKRDQYESQRMLQQRAPKFVQSRVDPAAETHNREPEQRKKRPLKIKESVAEINNRR